MGEQMSETNKANSRREFLKFMGATATTSIALGALPGCQTSKTASTTQAFKPLKPDSTDELTLAPGFSYKTLIKYDDVINTNGDRFGYNNDYIAYIGDKDQGMIMVNHEYNNPLFVSGYDKNSDIKKTKEQFEKERKALGVSLLKIEKTKKNWAVDIKDTKNKKIHGASKIPIISDRKITSNNIAIGTMGNLSLIHI